LQGGEAAAPVDLVRIARAKDAAVDTRSLTVLQDALHQPGADPASSMRLIDEHVTDPGEGGPVRDNTREGCLELSGKHRVRA
jgi:hypothetical protein